MEKAPHTEKLAPQEAKGKSKELLKNKIEKARSAEHLDVSEARQAVEQLAAPAAEKTAADAPAEEQNNTWWSRELSSQTFDKTLASVRRRLNVPEKQFSRFIHNKGVEAVSDATGKTVARPSGILFGGIFAFIGSSFAYLLARHLGGEMKLSIFAVTFVGGYILGLFVELIVRALRHKR